MRFWPFGRKRRRANKAKAESLETKVGVKGHANTVSMSTGRPASAGREQTPRRRLSKRVAPPSGRDGKGRMSGEGSVPAKIPGQGMSEKQPMPGGSVEDITALPITAAHGRNALWGSAGRDSLEKPYNVHRQDSTTNQSERGIFSTLQRPPSLRSKPSAAESNLLGRRSSKKRKDDTIREEEIRAMSSPLPASRRPSSHGSDGLLRRDSKRVRDGLNIRFQRPESNISLPLANSLRSGTPIPVDEHKFKVRNIFSPRPTIRYSGALHDYRPSSAGTSAAESVSQRRPRLSKEIIEESSTIDELADDLDAGGLKALMDRDQRRRDRKRVQDEERARRRLQRKADKQRAEEQQRDAEYAALRQSKSREFASDTQAPVDIGIEAGPSTTTEIPPIPVTADKYSHVNTGTYLDYSKVPIPPDPHSESAVEPGSPTSGQRTPWEEAQTPYEEPVVNTAQAVRYSQASVTTPTSPNFHGRGPSNVSVPSDLRGQAVAEYPEIPDKSPKRTAPVQVQEIADQPQEAPRETERRGSDLSGRRTSTWATIFKRGGTAKRASQDHGGPLASQASFSNRSRESMSRQPTPGQLQQGPGIPQTRSGTITPIRTQSRFREDLPELPLPPSHPVIPPPEAWIQSSEATESPPRPITAQRNATPLKIETRFAKLGVKGSFEDPILKRGDSPLDAEARDSAVMSQSLASVDSEGSWLSGRTSQRASQQRLAQTPPIPSLPVDADYPTPVEGFHVEDIRYGPLYAPCSQIGGLPQHESEAVSIGSETGSEMEQSPVETHNPREETIVHGGVSRTPTVVRREAHLNSKEGLVNDLQAEEESQYSSSPHEEVAEKALFSQGESAPEPSEQLPEQPVEQSSEQWSEMSRDQSPVESSDHSSEQSPVQGPVELKRARSFDYGPHHARAMSAGSAKLLDIPARTGSVSQRSSPTTPAFKEGLSKQRSAAMPETPTKLEGQAGGSTA